MSNLFDAQTKDQIESRMVQTLHTLTDTDKTSIEGSFVRDMIDTNAVEFENSYAEMAMLRDGYRAVRGLHHTWQPVPDEGRVAVLHHGVGNDSS